MADDVPVRVRDRDRKSTRLNSSHQIISYAVFCLKKKKNIITCRCQNPSPRTSYSSLLSLNEACLPFFFNDTATTEIYTLSLHDALPIWSVAGALSAMPRSPSSAACLAPAR